MSRSQAPPAYSPLPLGTKISKGLVWRFSRRLSGQTDWPEFGHNRGAKRHWPLTQSNTTNVSSSVPEWSFSMQKPDVREYCLRAPE
jgi:hypothetical protein